MVSIREDGIYPFGFIKAGNLTGIVTINLQGMMKLVIATLGITVGL
jgi:hypothetical protein